ncbi:hypothetical protein PUMCH_000656 [Australozyma saopauloensis]|uniref:Serine aminopeptidase S33 domain-containing protein n=1 Tax=Australozyma saopauloensis TaxID=291208 RepID=A0AAX4H4G3_9ASCO|nr:hypothetical protein PUMCH_000656 [[Candida] saopauloensis]
MPETEIPYKAIGSPIVELVPYDNLNFKTVTWKVPANVTRKGTIVYVHGFFEHSSIYTEFFDRLSQHGYEIFFFDQRGAGATSPGKLVGKTDEFHTFDDLDFMLLRILAARENKAEKIFLAGHSMGGGIVLNYAIHGKYRDDIRGAFVLGPLVELHPKTRPNVVVMKLQPLINAIAPGLKVDSKLNYDYITSNERWRNYIRATDKKLIGTIRQFNDMFNRGWKLLEPAHVRQFSPSIPLLVFHGKDDNINHIEGTEKFLKLLPSSVESEFVAVPEARHSVFLEKDEIVSTVIDKVVEFLDKH